MRDLAGQNFGRKRSRGMLAILRLLLVIFILGTVLYFVWGRLIGGGGSSSMILKDAQGGLTPVPVSGSKVSGSGINLTTQKAVLSDIKYGGNASGVATRSFGGGTYILSVSATLPDPKNTYYEVWLVGGGKTVPIDFMRGSKNSWSLSLRDQDKFSSYDGIWVTLERTKDNLPEERVLEGSF